MTEKIDNHQPETENNHQPETENNHQPETENNHQPETENAPAAAAPIVQTTPTMPDKLAPYRALFGMPVAVQFHAQAPYIQIAPLTDGEGNVATVQVPNTGRIIGLPAVAAEQQQATAVAIGVLRPSDDGTWLIIEERLAVPRTGASPGGQALMDVYVRPELVTHISFVKAIELRRPQRAEA